MITAEPVPIPEAVSKRLRDWLDKPELKTLVRVAEAHQKTAQAKAVSPAEKAIPDYPAKLIEADKHLAEAHRYGVFIEILQKIASQTEFNDVKLS